MYRIYKYVRYETTNGDVVTDDCMLDVVRTGIGVVDRIDVDMREYIEKSRFIKEWYDCDFHVEKTNDKGKWKFLRTISCEIDNENRNITINHPIDYEWDELE